MGVGGEAGSRSYPDIHKPHSQELNVSCYRCNHKMIQAKTVWKTLVKATEGEGSKTYRENFTDFIKAAAAICSSSAFRIKISNSNEQTHEGIMILHDKIKNPKYFVSV